MTRSDTWKVFFNVMTKWRKDPATLRLFQIVEQEYGKEWMSDVVAPKQKELLKELYLWTTQSWSEIFQEMKQMAIKHQSLPTTVTRFKVDLEVAIGDTMPEFPMVDLSSSKNTTIQQLLQKKNFGVVVAGSLT